MLEKGTSHPRWHREGQRKTSSCCSERCAIKNLHIVYCWHFPFNIFGTWLTVGNQNHKQWNCGWGGTTLVRSSAPCMVGRGDGDVNFSSEPQCFPLNFIHTVWKSITDHGKGHTGPPEEVIEKGHLRIIIIIANLYRVQGITKIKNAITYFRMAD